MSTIELFRRQDQTGYVVAEWSKDSGYVVRSAHLGQTRQERRYAFEKNAVTAAKRLASRLRIAPSLPKLSVGETARVLEGLRLLRDRERHEDERMYLNRIINKLSTEQ